MNLLKTSQVEIAVSKVDKPVVNSQTVITLPIDMFLKMYKALPKLSFVEHKDLFIDKLYSTHTHEEWESVIKEECARLELDKECSNLEQDYNTYLKKEF